MIDIAPNPIQCGPSRPTLIHFVGLLYSPVEMVPVEAPSEALASLVDTSVPLFCAVVAAAEVLVSLTEASLPSPEAYTGAMDFTFQVTPSLTSEIL